MPIYVLHLNWVVQNYIKYSHDTHGIHVQLYLYSNGYVLKTGDFDLLLFLSQA